jgi:hypothetical protein
MEYRDSRIRRRFVRLGSKLYPAISHPGNRTGIAKFLLQNDFWSPSHLAAQLLPYLGQIFFFEIPTKRPGGAAD